MTNLNPESCLSRAANALLSRRNPAGFWEGRLASSPLATAVALCALMDENDPQFNTSAAIDYLGRVQNADGGWGDTEISKSNLAATALTLCAECMYRFLSKTALQRAEAYLESLGGLEAALARVYGKDLTFQVPIRMTAAFTGLRARSSELHSWRKVNALPFELALAPRWLMGALGLPVVSYALPALVCVGLSRHARAPSRFLPLRWLREWVSKTALQRIEAMQPSSGGFLEAIPITAFCMIGLKAAGRGGHAVAQNARRFLLATQRPDGSWPVEVNLSVWNTTRAIDALGSAGLLYEALSESERAVTRDWLLAQQVTKPHPYTGAAPGGWGWNHLPGSVPDADDTAGAILALRHLGLPPEHSALQMGKAWLLSLQNRDGGWPTFCRGWQKLPFDRSAPDLTAHALRALHTLGEERHAACLGGWAYLQKVQHSDGSFAPLWFGCESAGDQANATYGTSAVLFACKDQREGEAIRDRALAWLRGIQNADGGFGGVKGAPSTAEETGLALRALAASARGEDTASQRAARWLGEHQRPDGSWPPAPIGFYFAVLWYYEELYPLCYALGGIGQQAKVDSLPATRK